MDSGHGPVLMVKLRKYGKRDGIMVGEVLVSSRPWPCVDHQVAPKFERVFGPVLQRVIQQFGHPAPFPPDEVVAVGMPGGGFGQAAVGRE